MKVAKIVILVLLLVMVSCKKDNGGPVYPEPDYDYIETDVDQTVDWGKDDRDVEDPDVIDEDPDVIDEDADTNDEDQDEPESDDVPDPDNPIVDDEIDIDQPDADIPVGVCGNGITEVGEECDNGDYNSDDPGKIGVTCRTSCQYAKCGDSIIDNPYEICDDGNSDDGDYCSANCMTLVGSCGDGKIQANEACDNAYAGEGIGGYCSNDCLSIVGSCGDGMKQDHEKCDNAEFGDGIGPFYCSSDCKDVIGSCGDGVKQDNENCDDGENNGRYGFCTPLCDGLGRRCGDGVKDIGYEACDDGNNDDNDYCSPDCQTELGRCGDGVIQPNESCDKAIFGDGTGEYCSDDCLTVLGECGDETVQDNEECDWGLANGSPFCEYGVETSCTSCNDVCNFVTGIPTFCGDGKIDVQNGEACDNAASDVGDGEGTGVYCSFDCKAVAGFCGDGAVQSNEACDKATFYDGIGPEYCSDDCKTIIGSCGDGTLHTTMEECDEGANNTDTCEYNETSCTVCSTGCKTISGALDYCGDGRVNSDHEFCDSGSNNGEYKTDYPGYCNTGCQGIGAGGYCGDDIVQGSHEQCDNGEDNGASECEYGTESCDVCTPGCQLAPATGKYCGDDIITNGENCDDGEDNGTHGHCKSDCTGMGPGCGNGVIDGTEFCDDGEDNGTYGKCNFQCTAVLECGDGLKNGSEACDSGSDNGTYKLEAPGNCNSDCQGIGEAGFCGNSTVESGNEECDHGGLITADCDYGETECTVCDAECKEQSGNVKYCGDGITQTSEGETCDDGVDNGTYGHCASDCKSDGEYCGDGIKNGTENCDDGEDNGTHGFCKLDCSGMGTYCGDGIQNGTDICDDGANNGSYGYCKSDCTGLGERCGDGIEQSGEGENCDDGPSNGTYGYCKSDCTGMGEYCGDGTQNGPETCDDGVNNGSYGYCNAECSGPATGCGDGILQTSEGEVCDDGVDNGTYDHCKSDCSGHGPYCGDGIQNGEETCDDGAENGNYNKCNETCDGQGPHCGDGSLQGDEVCDDGANNGNYDYCAADCSGPGLRCGDGIQNGGETCDDGLLNGSEGYCSSDCSGPHEYCGDGTQNGTEACDDGENNGTQGYCKSDCSGMVEYCGDGIKNGTEECDNGENNGTTQCTYGETSCKVCTDMCKEQDGIPSYCGDNQTDSGNGEVCDDGSNNGLYYFLSPGYCNSNCDGYGEGGYCGDGVTAGDEECDDGSNNGEPGYCSSICGTTESCGNGVVESGEFCDTDDFVCGSIGQFTSGSVACPVDCSVPDLSSCVDNSGYSSPYFTTSQTDCYNNTTSITCPSSGSSFYGQEPQYSYGTQSFTSDTYTVTESESGLMWQKDTPTAYTGCTQGAPSGSKCTVGEALDYCSSLSLGGHSDWRLPTTLEFSTIMHFAQNSPLTHSDFTSTQSENYWSIGYIYHLISMSDGSTQVSNKTSVGNVKCVRGANQYPESEIISKDDLYVSVLDRSSNTLVFWQYDSTQTAVTWENALNYCENVTENGLDGFRLPTIVELQGFVFESLYNDPKVTDTGSFWTSTTLDSDPANAYIVDFSTGNSNYSSKAGTALVMCVKQFPSYFQPCFELFSVI